MNAKKQKVEQVVEQIKEPVIILLIYLNLSLALIYWNIGFIAVAILVYGIERIEIPIMMIVTMLIGVTSNTVLLISITIIFMSLVLLERIRKNIVTALILAGIASSMVTSGYYCNVAKKVCEIPMSMQRVSGELGIDRLISELNSNKLYKNSLYKVIDTIKEDSVYMADISGTEDTEEAKIKYLEGIAVKFLSDQNTSLEGISTDSLKDNRLVDASIQKYLNGKK